MNANELADELADKLEGYGVVYVKFEYRKQAATMLRQQQEKLEFSENRLKLSNDAFDAIERKVSQMQEERLKLIGTLKWAEDLLREDGHDDAVSDVQDCLMIIRNVGEK